ncbi:unnamed protein product [Nezara viridula]|uniref:Uncharacterized protein n=1 Tax=Nezara viridula TaxID=85310 RepID=A0A9P0H820_NEZVI|nr:unnamed protein product [Nezara viridula]
MKATGTIVEVFALLCLIQTCCAWKKFTSLSVKTNAFGIDKQDAFYEIPSGTNNPAMKNFVKVNPEPSFKFPLEFYCNPGDPRVCFMYDKKGNIAGVQISVLKSDVAHINKEDYDYESIGEYVKTNFFNIPAYSSRVFFTNPEKLTEKGRQNTEEIAEGLWAYLDGKLVEIQRKEPTGPKMGDFDRQGCYPAMGQHYIYKYNKDSSCKDHYSLFPLYEQGGLVGYGFSAPAKYSKLKADWYEKPTGEAMKVILTNPPKCSSNAGSKYSYISLHVFLVDRPWNISCP